MMGEKKKKDRLLRDLAKLLRDPEKRFARSRETFCEIPRNFCEISQTKYSKPDRCFVERKKRSNGGC